MEKIIFKGQIFNTESERDAYVFHNKQKLLSENKFKLFPPLLLGLILGTFLGAIFSSWIIFLLCIMLWPFAVILARSSRRKAIEKYSDVHEEFLVEAEKKIKDPILDSRKKRNSPDGLKDKPLSDLTTRINHEYSLSFTDEDTEYVLRLKTERK